MDKIYDNAVVGSMDILGFKTIALNKELGLNYMDILSNIAHNLTLGNQIYTNDDNWKPVDSLFWYSESFGDSIYLMANPEEPIKKQVEKLALRIASTLLQGVLFSFKFAIRGSISIGTLVDRESDFAGNKVRIRMGPALVKAHELEASQQWMGIGIDPELEPFLDGGAYFLRYPVPTKPGKPVSSYSVNWPTMLKDVSNIPIPHNIEERIEEIFKKPGSWNKDIEIKLQNTLEFYRKYRET